ncbi:DUF6602 domain-containing protein [Streptomyces sp. NPDC052127]
MASTTTQTGKPAGHQWAVLMATSGKKHWPPMGRTQWPLTTGGQSEQIDIAIYDRQYSPIWFQSPAGERIVPVESIYAVFEVKQKVDASKLRYASEKAASVRRLTRTSGKIVDIHGTHNGPRTAQRPILSGILALDSGWKSGIRSETGKSHIERTIGDARLDMGLALLDAAFDNTTPPYNEEMLEPGLHFSPEGTQLLWFCLRLFRRLQAIGTAPAVDLSLYEDALFKSSSPPHPVESLQDE